MNLPEIPNSWIIFALLIGLVIMRFFSIDSWVTASISSLIGYLVGVKLEQTRSPRN